MNICYSEQRKYEKYIYWTLCVENDMERRNRNGFGRWIMWDMPLSIKSIACYVAQDEYVPSVCTSKANTRSSGAGSKRERAREENIWRIYVKRATTSYVVCANVVVVVVSSYVDPLRVPKVQRSSRYMCASAATRFLTNIPSTFQSPDSHIRSLNFLLSTRLKGGILEHDGVFRNFQTLYKRNKWL